jgi:hypothetical protein
VAKAQSHDGVVYLGIQEFGKLCITEARTIICNQIVRQFVLLGHDVELFNYLSYSRRYCDKPLKVSSVVITSMYSPDGSGLRKSTEMHSHALDGRVVLVIRSGGGCLETD